MTPCANGWREVVDADDPDLVTCDPWPEDGPEDCAIDEAHFPGRPGCERIGTPCPLGDWAEDIPADATVVYVKAGAPAGGDGTRAAPFARIAEGVDTAPVGAIVAISKGTFDEVVIVRRAVTLWGACVAQTVVSSSEEIAAAWTCGSPIATVMFTGPPGGGLRNVRVSGPRPGVFVTGNAEVRSVVVHDTLGGGIVSCAGTITSTDVVVRDMREPAWDWPTFALDLLNPGRAEVLSGSFLGSGIRIAMGFQLVAEDVVVRDTDSREGNAYDRVGITIVAGRMEMRRSTVMGSGWGIEVTGGGTLFGELLAEDAVIQDTSGVGINVSTGRAEVVRTVVDRSQQFGISSMGGELVATDVVVRDSRFTGITTGTTLSADLVRAYVARSGGGIVATGNFAAEDLVIAKTHEPEAVSSGLGLFVVQGHSEIVRAEIEGCRDAGVLVLGTRAELLASDFAIRATAPRELNGTGGYGMDVQGGARVEILRALLERNHSVGMIVSGAGTDLFGTQLAIRETLNRGDGEYGTGVLAIADAHVGITRFAVSDNELCGLQLVDGGTIDLVQGEVLRNRIGANVQTEGFDLARLQDRVVYLANEVELDGALMSVPDPVVPPEEPR